MCKFLFLLCLGLGLNCEVLALGATIFESGTLGPTGVSWQEALDGDVSASSVDDVTFSGVQFELTQPVITTQIGGHFLSPLGGEFFGAIVKLDDENDFPDSGDLSTSDVLGNATLIFPVLSEEAFGDLSISLVPGWYALVFGDGLFGVDGIGGGMPLNNPDIGTPTYIGFQPGNSVGWFKVSGFQTPLVDYRFVILGSIVPEPSTVCLVLIASLILINSNLCCRP